MTGATGYIGSTEVEKILIDPGLTLSIMLVCLIEFMHIPIRKLSTTATMNTVSMHRVADLLETFN